jgi:diguanylate cyclase (GGDEF)-like protein/PAS domain S-box-containing protein
MHKTYPEWSTTLIAMQQAVVDAGTDFDAVMKAVTEGALQVLPQANGAVVEMREGDELCYRVASGASAPYVGLRLRLDKSLSGRAILTGQFQTCPDTEEDSFADRPACRRIGIRSMLVVPLIYQGEAVGVLKIHAAEPHVFGAGDLLAVQLLSGPIVIGLSNLGAADAQRARQLADRRFEATFAHAPVGIAHVAPDGGLLLVNDRFCMITGWARAELLEHRFQRITHPDDLSADLAHVGRLMSGKAERYSMEKRYLRPDGSHVWVNLTVSLVRDQQGAPDFFVAVIEDISEIRRVQAEALRDPLTGALNRRGLTERLEQAMARASRNDGWLSLAYLDLDGFKQVNEDHGHAEGDMLLVDIARALGEVLRPGDDVARVGGDEFVMIMPDLDEKHAGAVVERARMAVMEVGKARLSPISGSFGGVCCVPRPGQPPEDLIARADRAMFQAKKAGKNQACLVVDSTLP